MKFLVPFLANIGQFWPIFYIKPCKQYVGETPKIFHKRWYNYKYNARKLLRGESCMQQHLFDNFLSSGHNGFIEDVCITFIDKTKSFIPMRMRITGDKHSKLWLHMVLTSKSFILQCFTFYVVLLSSF